MDAPNTADGKLAAVAVQAVFLTEAFDFPPSNQFLKPHLGCYAAVVADALVGFADLAYPRRADGKTLYPFRRVFIVARR